MIAAIAETAVVVLVGAVWIAGGIAALKHFNRETER